MIVAEASYEVTDPTIDLQVLKIKDAGADLFFSASTPKQAAQAIKKIAELGWHPIQIVDINATSVGAVLKPAGLEASKDLISTNYGKDPSDPQWKDDPGMKHYFDFMAKYYPDGDKNSNFNTYGYSTAQLMVHVLKQCGDDLTRENVMKQATNLKNVELDLSLPGMKANTTRERLPRQQADADDEVQRRALGIVRPDSRGRRSRRLVEYSLTRTIGGPSRPPICFYCGISPNVFPTGSTACRIRRESSTAAWRCFTASR